MHTLSTPVMRENTTLALTLVLIKSPDSNSEACPLHTVGISLGGKFKHLVFFSTSKFFFD